MKIRNLRERLSTVAAAAGFAWMSMQAAAAPLSLVDVPLFLSASVKPNLIMAIDDSGSMDAEMLLRSNDGAAWWRRQTVNSCDATNNNSFVGCINNAAGDSNIPAAGRLNFNNAGDATATFKKYTYLFPNGEGNNTEDRRRLGDGGNHDHYAVAPIGAFAWSRSPEYNGAYFDPTQVYTPWPNGGGFTFTNANIYAAEWDPVYNGAGSIDLTRDIAGDANPNLGSACSGSDTTLPATSWGFRLFTGMTLPEGTCFYRTNVTAPAVAHWTEVRPGGTCQVGVAGGCQVGTVSTPENFQLNENASVFIRYYPATFYLSTATAPAAFNYTAVPPGDGVAPDGTTLYRYEIKEGNFASTADYTAAMQNFANYFMYYRKRHMALRAGLGRAFDTLTGTRVAGFTINQAAATGNPPSGPNVTMLDIDNPTSRSDLYYRFYYSWTGGGGTPNRRAVYNIIRNFQRSAAGSPVTNSCQRNFGMLFTDGFSNPAETGDGLNAIGNLDGALGAPYADGVSNTLADGVYGAYNTPLLSTAFFPAGKVIVPSACSSATPDPKLDCNKNLHMNFYAITLGARGLQFDPDAAPPQDPFVTAPTWPTTFPARHPSAVDDLWHATINGRGQLLNAASSAELADKLSAVLRSIIERVGSASSAAVNSGSISSDTRLFQASFDSKDWSGRLTARAVETGGLLGTEVSATIPTTRQIITVNSAGAAVPFVWGSLDTTRQAELQPTDPAADLRGSARLDWIRGDQSNEFPNGFDFRARTTLLGDIINSAPAYVGAPTFRYPDTLESAPYSAFRTAHLNRQHMVYVGGNDGMLHAFYSDDDNAAGTGVVEEQFAFVPGSVFKHLHNLPSTAYSHRYYVDGSPVTGDAFTGGAWRTMLVSGLNKGGQGVFALDVTNPAALTESNATNVFRWEFTDANDRDMGYSFSRPSIVKLNDGSWAAVFGNGYNSTVTGGGDVYASTTGNAVLFIVDLWTGALLAKIDTGVGTAASGAAARPNGLSTPVLIDSDGDSDVDYAYAGDLLGNLWKFNLTSTSSGSWAVANAGAALFTAQYGTSPTTLIRQPITSRPNVSRGPRGQGFTIVFGTGKYIETGDNVVGTAAANRQSFYGIHDPNTGLASDIILPGTTGRDNLHQQTITGEVTVTALGTLRTTSNTVPPATARGWYIDFVRPSPLAFQGEMQVTDSLIRNGRVVFTTLVPNTDPCEFGGESWLMEMNLFTGQRPDRTPFDLNNDKIFNDDQAGIPVTGVKTTVGITPKPAPLTDPESNCDYLIFPGTSGGTESRCRDPGPRGFGRQSWRQVN